MHDPPGLGAGSPGQARLGAVLLRALRGGLRLSGARRELIRGYPGLFGAAIDRGES